jgi:hypothetical protein
MESRVGRFTEGTVEQVAEEHFLGGGKGKWHIESHYPSKDVALGRYEL